MTPEDYEALASFRYALRQFLRFSEEAAASNNLTPQKYQTLIAIRGFTADRKITIGDLAERLQIRHHSTVGLVDRLVKQGLITREQGVQDRRQVFVVLTPEGEALMDKLGPVHRAELRRLGPTLQSALSNLLRKNSV